MYSLARKRLDEKGSSVALSTVEAKCVPFVRRGGSIDLHELGDLLVLWRGRNPVDGATDPQSGDEMIDPSYAGAPCVILELAG